MLNKPARNAFIDGRIPITVEQYLHYDYFTDWDANAYLYTVGNAARGMEPWRVAGGIYRANDEDMIFIMYGVMNEMKVDLDYLVYVTEQDFDAAVHNAEAYFVGTDCEEPLQIFFERELATAGQYRYLDSFDSEGKRVASYKLKDDNSGYTQDF